MTCFFDHFCQCGSAFFQLSPVIIVWHINVCRLKFKHIYFEWSKKKRRHTKCYALNLNFPRPLIQYRDSISWSAPGFRFIENVWFVEVACNVNKSMKNKSLSMFSNKNPKWIQWLINVCVRFFFTIEIFSFIDNPNNPFRWLVKKSFVLFRVGVVIVVCFYWWCLRCRDQPKQKNAKEMHKFSLEKKSLSSPKRKYYLIRDYMSV